MRKGWMFGPLAAVLRDAAGEGGEGGGGGAAGGVDAAAITKAIMAEVNKTLNGFAKTLKADVEKLVKPPAGSGSGTGEGEGSGGEGGQGGDGGTNGGTQKPDPKMTALERRLKAAEEKFEASEKARLETEGKAKQERLQGQLRTELLKQGIPAERVDSAMRIFGPDVRYTDDGQIVAGADEQPLSEYLSTTIKQHEYLLPPRPVGGAGAGAGRGGTGGGKAFTIDDIKPGMKPEEYNAIASQIATALKP